MMDELGGGALWLINSSFGNRIFMSSARRMATTGGSAMWRSEMITRVIRIARTCIRTSIATSVSDIPLLCVPGCNG